MKYWDDAWGLVGGCTPCSPGCRSCWSAAAANMRSHQKNQKVRTQYEGLTCLRNGVPTYNGTIRLFHDRLELPLRRRKPTVWSIWNDLFHEDVPEDFIRETHWTMQRCGWHRFLVLTKRAERMAAFFSSRQDAPFLPHVYYGLTICNQPEADTMLSPWNSAVPGMKFLSIEPMLGPIDLNEADPEWWISTGINAVIIGGETGPHARPLQPDWVRKVRDDCASVGMPFFFKYFGDGNRMKWETTTGRGGRLLDGREHNDMPWRSCL